MKSEQTRKNPSETSVFQKETLAEHRSELGKTENDAVHIGLIGDFPEYWEFIVLFALLLTFIAPLYASFLNPPLLQVIQISIQENVGTKLAKRAAIISVLQVSQTFLFFFAGFRQYTTDTE